MTAQPIHQPAKPPRIPRTPKGIRQHLSPGNQDRFDAAWSDLDLDDFAAVAAWRDEWWCRAMYDTDPTIAQDFAKLAAGTLELVPSPLRNR